MPALRMTQEDFDRWVASGRVREVGGASGGKARTGSSVTPSSEPEEEPVPPPLPRWWTPGAAKPTTPPPAPQPATKVTARASKPAQKAVLSCTVSLPLRLVIRGEPVPKGRPRSQGAVVGPDGKPHFKTLKVPAHWVNREISARVHHYTPSETSEAETRIREHALAHIGSAAPVQDPVDVVVTVYRRRGMPSSKIGQARAERGEVVPATKPDGDNYLKLACDALNGIVWRDDGQVVDKTVRKRFSADPRLEIEIRHHAYPEKCSSDDQK